MKEKNLQIIIRKAKIEDIPKIIPLLRGIAQYHHKLNPIYTPGSKIPSDAPQRLAKLVRKIKAVLIVAESNGKLVGYFVADIRKTRMRVYNKIGYIQDGFVDQKYRRKNIGKDLFDWIKEWFLKHNVKRIELMVDSNNPAGIKAWQKYGFKEYQKKMQIEI